MCTHYWLVETVATSSEYHAVCKYCAEERTFPVTPQLVGPDREMEIARRIWKADYTLVWELGSNSPWL